MEPRPRVLWSEGLFLTPQHLQQQDRVGLLLFEEQAVVEVKPQGQQFDTAKFLGIGIANFLNIFNPEVVVIAGGVTQAGEALFEPLRAEVRRRAFAPAVEACRIVPGELHGNAGVVGAVAIFLQARGLA